MHTQRSQLQSSAVTTFIERVALMNYKSIARCDVSLRPLTVIVGRNGSGKSNFVDSLHFVADALTTSLEYAIRKRGGIKSVIHRRGGGRLRIEITFGMRGTDVIGVFALELRRGAVQHESLNIQVGDGISAARYVRNGRSLTAEAVGETLIVPPAVFSDRLALVSLSGLKEFREAFETLASMRFYRLNPDVMREIQNPDEGEVLTEDGSNLPSVWGRMQKLRPELLDRLTSYLTAIVPEIRKVRRVTLGTRETLRFYQSVAGRDVMFPASSMSDGTLRALGALTASRQNNGSQASSVVVIEEPETALHPGAVAALMDALHESSATTQILVTSHSPDVLDHVDIDGDVLLVTEVRDGATAIGEVDGASLEAIRRHLYTPGDLLRMDQLQPGSTSA
jgi:predicted ATPase